MVLISPDYTIYTHTCTLTVTMVYITGWHSRHYRIYHLHNVNWYHHNREAQPRVR